MTEFKKYEKTSSNRSSIFQADNAPIHTARVVKNWHEEHDNELEHNIQRQVNNRYPPPPCMKVLEQVLMEE